MFTSRSAPKEDRVNSEPAIRLAMNLTAHTIDRRAWWYRNLVVSVVVLPLACALSAGITRSGYPFLGLFLLVPLCGYFFWLDGRQVRHWQQGVLAYWVQGDLDPTVFSQAVSANRHLPKRTLQGMLSVLPNEGSVSTGCCMKPATRQAVYQTCDCIQKCELDRMAGLTLAATLCAGSLVAWLVLGKSAALFGLATSIMIFPAPYLIARLRLRALKQELTCQRQNPVFELNCYIEAAQRLHWGTITALRKTDFLNAITENRNDRRNKNHLAA